MNHIKDAYLNKLMIHCNLHTSYEFNRCATAKALILMAYKVNLALLINGLDEP